MEQSISRWIKIILAVALVAGVIYFLVSIGDLVQLLVISALLAYILDPLVTLIESNGISRTMSTVIFFLALTLIGGVTIILLMPIIGAEIVTMSTGFDASKAQETIDKINLFFNDNFSFLGGQDLNLTSELADQLVDFGNAILTNIFSMFTIVTSLVIIPFVVFFFLKDGRSVKKGLISLVPNRYFELTCNLLYKMDVQLGNYLRGVVIDALIIGILSTLAMWLLGVQNFLIIGLFAGMANLIPYIGPLCGAVLAILLSLLNSGDLELVVYIAVAFAIVQFTDNVIVQPSVVAKNVNLPPLIVLLVVIIGGKFFGILGMILSVPVTAILKVTIQEAMKIYRQYRFT